jgi:spermidine synthase
MKTILALCFALVTWLPEASFANPSPAEYRNGPVEHEVKSPFSHIRIRRRGTFRTLLFVRDSGEEAAQSRVDLTAKHELQFDYLRSMLTSYLFEPKQDRVLLIGLGGGSIVHFLNKYFPATAVDAVEIDPIVVKLAQDYFELKPHPKTQIFTEDGFEFLKSNHGKYDTVYMDAFLKPSANTDETGVALQQRTVAFYKQIQKVLTDKGQVVFNINSHSKIAEDVASIANAFPSTYVFDLPFQSGKIVVGSMKRVLRSSEETCKEAKKIDAKLKASFLFAQMCRFDQRFPTKSK